MLKRSRKPKTQTRVPKRVTLRIPRVDGAHVELSRTRGFSPSRISDWLVKALRGRSDV